MRKRIILALAAVILAVGSVCTSYDAFQDRNVNISVKIETAVSQTEKSISAEKAKESGTEKETEKHSEETETTAKRKEETTADEKVNTSQRTEETTAEPERHTTPNKTTTEKAEPQEITVSLTISCLNAVDYGADVPNYFLNNESYTAKEGATVFDALKSLCSENGISLKYQSKTYIQGIGGLNEKDCGGGSGWMYRVNGTAPNKPASSYVLKNGDTVEWYYVTGPKDN